MDGNVVEVLFDAECPLCMREIRMLQRLDKRGRIRFTDITDPSFDPAEYGRTFDDVMERIHGRLPDGTIIEGVEVFRQLYSAVGFSRISSLTRLPGISSGLDWAYQRFAKNRLKLTGRCVKDESGACEVPRPA